MQIISLTPLDLSIAALLVMSLAVLSFFLRLGIGKRLLIAAARTALQLTLVGFILKPLFDHANPYFLLLIALFMLSMAGREIMQRVKRRFSGWWGYGLGTLSMSISSFSVTFLALTLVIHVRPWYEPQYAIPLLGMLLGNTMNGISIGLNRLTSAAWEQKLIIETRLMLGADWDSAIRDIRHDSIRSALIPIINAMSVAGIVSLPGMMTGQILAGSPPLEAVKYQILIMFLIAGGTGFGTLTALWLGSKRLFDERHRLRLDRLTL